MYRNTSALSDEACYENELCCFRYEMGDSNQVAFHMVGDKEDEATQLWIIFANWNDIKTISLGEQTTG